MIEHKQWYKKMNSKDISYSFIHIIWKTLLFYMPAYKNVIHDIYTSTVQKKKDEEKIL